MRLLSHFVQQWLDMAEDSEVITKDTKDI